MWAHRIMLAAPSPPEIWSKFGRIIPFIPILEEIPIFWGWWKLWYFGWLFLQNSSLSNCCGYRTYNIWRTTMYDVWRTTYDVVWHTMTYDVRQRTMMYDVRCTTYLITNCSKNKSNCLNEEIQICYFLGDLVKLFKWAISINQKYKYKPSSEQF